MGKSDERTGNSAASSNSARDSVAKSDGKAFQVASRQALLSLDAVYGLAAFLNSLALPRRRVLDWLADVIFGFIEQGGVILDEHGVEIVIEPDTIDDAHGEDGSYEWISAQRQRANKLPQRRYRSAILLRLQIYDAAARIATGRSIVTFGESNRHNNNATPRCPNCGRLIQPWPKDSDHWCKTCINPKKLM